MLAQAQEKGNPIVSQDDGIAVDYRPLNRLSEVNDAESLAIKSEVRMNGVFLNEGETIERVGYRHRSEGARSVGR
jgi:hypothetical protein